MRTPHSITASLSLKVVFISDDWDEAPLSEQDQLELTRLLVHQLIAIKATLRRAEELQRRSA
jgi:hypothetical protein